MSPVRGPRVASDMELLAVRVVVLVLLLVAIFVGQVLR